MPDQLLEAWQRIDALPAHQHVATCPTCGAITATIRRLTPMQAAADKGSHAGAHRWLAYTVICRTCTDCGTSWDEKPRDHDTHKPATRARRPTLGRAASNTTPAAQQPTAT